ncbi:hypothetical protein BC937DRAFT_92496 [Endogone sp. FLAS-F59071]|nr:hypothetical protein BC937DRAFT_92496 [Endogone sp. FLAS-F59071]|eukprot:RUS15410.1 hypothetical protein BC937DRAFT_92496 [Endogone sp. FLAS-F59071]
MPPKGKFIKDENASPYSYISEEVKPTNNRNVPPSKYTPEEFNCLRETLKQQLGPEYLSTRPGPAGSGKLTYIDGHTAVELANEFFGFNGWSSSILGITVDYVDLENGKVSLGLSVVIRITLKDGTFHEDIGYGSMENSKSKCAAFEKAKKEAVTDGVKRALRYYGNALGNCLYDKKFVKDVAKLTCPPMPLKVEALRRRPQFAPQQTLTGPSLSAELPNTTTKATAFLNDSSKGNGANIPVLKSENCDEFEDNDDEMFSRMANDIESNRDMFFAEEPEADVKVTSAPWDNANVQTSTHCNSLSEGPDKKIPGMPLQALGPKTFVPTAGQDPKAVGNLPANPKFGMTQNRQFIPQLPAKGNSDTGIANPPPGSNINTGNGGSSMGPPVVNQSYVNSRPLNSQTTTANQQQNYNGNRLPMSGSLGPQGQSQVYRPQPSVLNKSTTGGGPNGGSGVVKQSSSVEGPTSLAGSLASTPSGAGSGNQNGGSGVSLVRQSSFVGAPTSLAGSLTSIPPSGAGSGGPNGSGVVRQSSSVGGTSLAGSLASIPSGAGSGNQNGGSGVSLVKQSSFVGAPTSLVGLPVSIPPSGAGNGGVMVSKGTKRPSSMDNIGIGMKAGGADPWFPNSAVETVNMGVGLVNGGDSSSGAIKRPKQG